MSHSFAKCKDLIPKLNRVFPPHSPVQRKFRDLVPYRIPGEDDNPLGTHIKWRLKPLALIFQMRSWSLYRLEASRNRLEQRYHPILLAKKQFFHILLAGSA
ncbi:hypothetical protein CDAR_280481 [Caerostris darwini]|uniref:Uncharacterized protein n=1 Tax=Caerostris darwini TaxID=1538125 RepID=A0AAV4U4N3_9ARAC|nr:hypothetical protein CDAR_280481 [Caerostris darwini]